MCGCKWDGHSMQQLLEHGGSVTCTWWTWCSLMWRIHGLSGFPVKKIGAAGRWTLHDLTLIFEKTVNHRMKPAVIWLFACLKFSGEDFQFGVSGLHGISWCYLSQWYSPNICCLSKRIGVPKCRWSWISKCWFWEGFLLKWWSACQVKLLRLVFSPLWVHFFFQKSEAGQSIGIKPWNMYKKVSSFAVPCTAQKFWSWSLLPGKVCPYSWCCPWFLDRRRRWVQNASVEKIGSSVGDSTVSTDEPWRVDWDLGRCWFHVGNLTA